PFKKADAVLRRSSMSPGVITDHLRASVAMPLISSVFLAKTRLFALDNDLGISGEPEGVVPLFRYEYLRDRAKETISQIQQIESRMLPIQFRLDDFSEAVATIRLNLAEQEAELAAANQKISGLLQSLTALMQGLREMERVSREVAVAAGQCDCGFWCWVGSI